MKRQLKYVFRWKENQIEVPSSWSYDPEEVWRFAVRGLRPAGMTDDKEAEKFMREHGEVVPLET